MSTIISCHCGVKVRVPSSNSRQGYRCPKCDGEIFFSRTADPITAAPARGGIVGALCLVCQTPIAKGESVLVCPGCDQPHHGECWAEIGGCGTYGCPQAHPAEKQESATEPAPQSAGWGDTKICPACGEQIRSIARKCRYCKAEFDTTDPISRAEYRRRYIRAPELEKARQTAITLTVAGLIPCFAPLLVLVNPIWFYLKREQVAKMGPLGRVLHWASIVVPALYVMILGVGWLLD